MSNINAFATKVMLDHLAALLKKEVKPEDNLAAVGFVSMDVIELTDNIEDDLGIAGMGDYRLRELREAVTVADAICVLEKALLEDLESFLSRMREEWMQDRGVNHFLQAEAEKAAL